MVTWCMSSVIVVNKPPNVNVCTGDCLFGQINAFVICLACYIFCVSVRYPLLKLSLLWLDWTQQIFCIWNWLIKLLFGGNWFCLLQSGLWLCRPSFLSHSENTIVLAQKCMCWQLKQGKERVHGCCSKTSNSLYVMASYIIQSENLDAVFFPTGLPLKLPLLCLWCLVRFYTLFFFICSFSFFTVLLTKPRKISNCWLKPWQQMSGMSLQMHVMWLQNNIAFSDQPFLAPAMYEVFEVLIG